MYLILFVGKDPLGNYTETKQKLDYETGVIKEKDRKLNLKITWFIKREEKLKDTK